MFKFLKRIYIKSIFNSNLIIYLYEYFLTINYLVKLLYFLTFGLKKIRNKEIFDKILTMRSYIKDFRVYQKGINSQ